jgi:hypothetical protein
MKTENEIRQRLALIEECITLGYILRLRATTPIENLEAFCDLLRWVLDEKPKKLE